MLALALVLALQPAVASDVTAAEHVRLSDDLEQLATRQLWPAVEKKFEELERLGVDLTYDDLVRGAHAARALGDTQAAYDRLKAAARMQGTREVVDWLFAIDSTYGHVELVTHNARGIVLAADEMPFEPDQRIAVQAAMDTVRKEGTFSGLLPRGQYTYAGHVFRVEPGIGVRIEVSPRLKKTSGILVNVSSAPTTLDGSTGPSSPEGEADTESP